MIHLKAFQLASIALLAAHVVNIRAQIEEAKEHRIDARTKGREVENYTIDIGQGLNLDVAHSSSKKHGKIKLNELDGRYTLRSDKFFGEGRMFKTKLSVTEEMIKCENLTLIRQDQLDKLDCRTLEEHKRSPYSLDESKASDVPLGSQADVKFVHSIRLKAKCTSYLFGETATRFELRMWSMKPEAIRIDIDSLSTAESDDVSFEVESRRGFYIETAILNQVGRLDCAGGFYVSVNMSNFQAPPDPDSWPNFVNDSQHLFNQALKGGYMLAIKNFKCQTNEYSLMKFNTNFKIIQRKTFPYLILNHNVRDEPLSAFLEYVANITQKRNEIDPNNPDAYTTRVSINSDSVIFPFLNFHMKQDFDYLNSSHGHEHMAFFYSDIVLGVQSYWNEKQHLKGLVFTNMSKWGSDYDTIGTFLYENSVSDKDINLRLSFDKSLFNFDSLWQDSPQPKPAQDEGRERKPIVIHTHNVTKTLIELLEAVVDKEPISARIEL